MPVTSCGLFVSRAHPNLACSPDGLLGQSHVVEIKCPHILREGKVSEFEKTLTKAQRSRFCLARDDTGCLYLKKSHQFYKQITLQMAITGRHRTLFTVWTPNDTIFLDIEFDETEFQQSFKKVIKYYSQVFLPEYFLQKTVRWLQPFNLETEWNLSVESSESYYEKILNASRKELWNIMEICRQKSMRCKYPDV